MRTDGKIQFHKGTIRTCEALPIAQPLCYFNSIKVRLEPVDAETLAHHISHFNSIKVRLEPPRSKRDA